MAPLQNSLKTLNPGAGVRSGDLTMEDLTVQDSRDRPREADALTTKPAPQDEQAAEAPLRAQSEGLELLLRRETGTEIG